MLTDICYCNVEQMGIPFVSSLTQPVTRSITLLLTVCFKGKFLLLTQQCFLAAKLLTLMQQVAQHTDTLPLQSPVCAVPSQATDKNTPQGTQCGRMHHAVLSDLINIRFCKRPRTFVSLFSI